MKGRILYSCNVFLKLLIHQRYRGDVHYVWCSEEFDSRSLDRSSLGAQVAPSANPADIYRELKRDVDGNDAHSAKINAQKVSLKGLAIQWEQNGEIAVTDRDDIVYWVDNAPLGLWRPVVYVIPWPADTTRIPLVPASQRAGIGEEYVIADLKRCEFDVIEL
jgi:hypothetical protein